MTVLIIFAVCAANILCFYIGARIGQKIIRDEDVTLPNPIEAIQEQMQQQRERRENQRVEERLDIILQNVESYDGTGWGQREVPGDKEG